MEKTNVIKLKYLRAGQPSGREYTFYTPAPVEVGDIVDIAVVSPDNTRETGRNLSGCKHNRRNDRPRSKCSHYRRIRRYCV